LTRGFIGTSTEKKLLLMPDRDKPDARIRQGKEEILILLARQAEDISDPLVFKAFDY
jgi:hypothetical protein